MGRGVTATRHAQISDTPAGSPHQAPDMSELPPLPMPSQAY